MDQPIQNAAVPAPSQWGWYALDLEEYRPVPDLFSTYWVFPYDSLPPISGVPFTGDFQWLTPLEADLDGHSQQYCPPAEIRTRPSPHIYAIDEQAHQLGLTLPPGFLRFMASSELQHRVPSRTACMFSLPERIVPYPGRENGYLLSFLWDSQACGIWRLYLTTDGAHRVLEAPYEFVELTRDGEQCSEATLADILAATYLCAPSFEEFLYRFWIENMIWYHLSGYNTAGTRISSKPLTEAQQRYLAHYARK